MQKLNTIFNISYGTKLDKNKTIERGNKPILFISRTSRNHGIDLICNEQVGIIPNEELTISVPLGGEGRLTANVQFSKYYNGQNVAILTPKDKNMPLNERIYYSLVIKKNQFKYSAFGREANSTLGDIMIPSRNEIPKFVKNDKIIEKTTKTNKLKINSYNKYKIFHLTELFDVLKGESISEEEAKKCKKGKISFVSSGKFNNGVKAKIALVGLETTIYPPFCLSLAKNGSVGVCFFHETSIVTTTDVIVLKYKEKILNNYEGLFFKVLIEKHIFRFNYGRKINDNRLEEIKIALPLDNQNKIDYPFINRKIKSLQFADLIH